MRSITASLTILAVLAHALLGCHAHHGHAAEAGPAEIELHIGGCDHGAARHCSQPSESPSEPGEDPCGAEDCVFSVSELKSSAIAAPQPSLDLVADWSSTIRSLPTDFRGYLLQETPPPPSGRPVLYCVLRN